MSSCAGADWIDAEYARRLLRRQLRTHDLVAWNDHPLRTKRQVLAAIDAALRTRPKRRGGWRVTTERIGVPRLPEKQLELELGA